MYSQHKEDEEIAMYLYESKLIDKISRFVVDIGAGDGLFLSNSRLFIDKLNFDALLVEPTEEQFFQLNNLYGLYPTPQKVIRENCAIDATVYRYSVKKGHHWTVNTIEKDLMGKQKTKTLSGLLKEHNITEVGLLSIDIEGLDIEVLKEFITNSEVRPALILIEAEGDSNLQITKNVLKDDYIFLRSFSFNRLFLNKKYA